MPKYYVSIPVAGILTTEVDAENEEAAKTLALNKIHSHEGVNWGDDIDWNEVGDLKLGFHARLVSGLTASNVLHAPQNEIDVQEVK